MSVTPNPDLIVVGAGPVGLIAGCEFARRGLRLPVADSVIADPEVVVAQRFGLTNGGRIVIRPDGYIGAVASLDDISTVADYFAAVRN